MIPAGLFPVANRGLKGSWSDTTHETDKMVIYIYMKEIGVFLLLFFQTINHKKNNIGESVQMDLPTPDFEW